jgi:DNA invertase Pin-like site-specific DNA recombinase
MVKLGYVRVSSDKQDPESQIKLMKEMGIADPDIFVDEGISGWTEPKDRPVYKKMLTRISDTKKEKVTEIVFSEFSRLGRNAKDSIYELIRLEKEGVHISSLSSHESFLNTIPAEVQLIVLSGMLTGAEMERKHTIERTKWGLKRVREYGSKSGKPMGRPRVVIDWEKIQKTMEQFRVPEKVAARICGYNESTFYKAKKELKTESDP